MAKLTLKDIANKLKEKFNLKAAQIASSPIINKAANSWQNTSNAIQTGQKFSPVPTITPFKGDSVLSKAGNFATNIPRSMVNSISQGITSPIMDVGNIIGQYVQGKEPQYEQMRGVGRLGMQIGGLISPTNTKNMGIKYGTKQVLGNLAEVAEPVVSAYVPKGAGAIAKSTIKLGFKEAVKKGAINAGVMGLGFGAVTGMSENRNVDSDTQYAMNVGASTLTGGAFGVLLGGVLGGSGYAYGKLRNVLADKFQAKYPKINRNQAIEWADGTIRDTAGRFLGKIPKEKPTPRMVGDMREELGLPRNGMTPEEINNRINLGLSIKEITPEQRLKLSTPPKGVGGEKITLYRAAPKFPSDKFSKGTYFADDAQKASYYSASHYKGNPSDIKVQQFTLPKDAVFREPSTGNYVLKGEVPVPQPKGVGVTKGNVPVNQVPQTPTKQLMELPKSPTTQIAGIEKPIKIQGISKPQGVQLKQTPQPSSVKETPIQGVGSSDTIISRTKSKINRIYTDVIDRFNPLSKTAKIAGEDQKMRNALTGHYGAGSTAQYHVDFELTPILKEQNINDLRRAAVAMRDVELESRGIRGSNTGNALKNLEKLKSELGEEKMKAVGETLNKLYKYQDEMVEKYLVKTGVISKSAYDSMRAKNQFYVPFKRVMDDVDEFLGFVPQTRSAGSVSGQTVIKGIKGSERQIVDPIESILESTYKMVGLGKRQGVARTIVSLKDKLPKGMIQKATGSVGNRPTISLFENGKVQKYLVPEDVAEAAKGLSEESLNSIVKILSVPTQVFRATATGINPEFMVPNVARDVQSAFVNAGLNPLRWVQGLAHMIKKDEIYKEFLKSGGKTSRISIDRPMLKQTVAGITSGKGFVIKKPSDILKVLQGAGEYSEQPTRIAVFEQKYLKGLKQGLSKEESAIRAAGWAQEGTVNFARRGAKTQSVNAIYAFLNARAQGVDRLVRTIKNDPVGATFRIGLITQVPAIAGYAWNRQFDSYYDDRVVSPTDRRTNFIIMLSDTPIPQLGGAQFIKIPKGDIGKLANPTEEFLRFAENKGGDVKKALFDVVRGFSPFDNIGDLIPTALRPPVEATVNKSFFTGYPIVPEYKTGLPAKYQDSSYTSPLYRMIGQKLGVSPAKLQAVVEGYGTGISKIAEMSTRGLVPDKYKTAKNEQGAEINKTPIVRRFLGGEKRTEEEQTKSNISKFNAIDFDINDIKSAIKRGDIPLEEGVKEIEKLQAEQQKTLTGITQTGSETLSDSQMDVEKLRFKYSDQTYKAIGNSLLYKNDAGNVEDISLDFDVETPKSTGNETLDKELKSDYRGEITKAKNAVMKAYGLGYFTQEQAITELEKLQTQYDASKTKKPKKITIKYSKVTAPKITIKKAQRTKMPTIKFTKPNIKTTKTKRNFTIKA